MKKETYRVYIRDIDGNAITFERFSYKRFKSVVNAMHTLLNNDLYKTCVGSFSTVEYWTVEKGEKVEMVKIEKY